MERPHLQRVPAELQEAYARIQATVIRYVMARTTSMDVYGSTVTQVLDLSGHVSDRQSDPYALRWTGETDAKGVREMEAMSWAELDGHLADLRTLLPALPVRGTIAADDTWVHERARQALARLELHALVTAVGRAGPPTVLLLQHELRLLHVDGTHAQQRAMQTLLEPGRWPALLLDLRVRYELRQATSRLTVDPDGVLLERF